MLPRKSSADADPSITSVEVTSFNVSEGISRRGLLALVDGVQARSDASMTRIENECLAPGARWCGGAGGGCPSDLGMLMQRVHTGTFYAFGAMQRLWPERRSSKDRVPIVSGFRRGLVAGSDLSAEREND
jgi:hypothetical protein